MINMVWLVINSNNQWLRGCHLQGGKAADIGLQMVQITRWFVQLHMWAETLGTLILDMLYFFVLWMLATQIAEI